MIDLRILATTDMHMQMLPYNYLKDHEPIGGSLARVATEIERNRGEVTNSLLLDNGDFLQGNPMGDLVALAAKSAPYQPHPVMIAMNALAYDAASIGNHDFSFGLDYLTQIVAEASFPCLAANLHVLRGRPLHRYAILPRKVIDRQGNKRVLNIGIIGFLPPQTSEWDHDLSQDIQCDDIVATAQRLIPLIRNEGAQIVVALAHSGIGNPAVLPRMENAATALAAMPGIDAVIAGHTHEVFPGPGFPPYPEIDPKKGSLFGKPAVMPGFGGSHLGIIDLKLGQNQIGDWQVLDFTVTCQPIGPETPVSETIATPLLTAHRQTARHFKRRVARLDAPLHSYFSLVGYDAGLRLVNMAQRWYIRNRLTGSKGQNLPVLAATAPFRAGGRSGPSHYTDIAEGRLDLGNLADLYTFPNHVCAVHLSGVQIQEWLERSAGLFLTIPAGAADAELTNPAFPSYNFDVIEGLSWQIDLVQPPRFTPEGRLINPNSHRVTDLTWHGRPVEPEAQFILATNTYRLATCGLFSSLNFRDQVVLQEKVMTRDVLHQYVRRLGKIDIAAQATWRFRPMSGTSVVFDSGHASHSGLDRVRETSHLDLTLLGPTHDGFLRYRLAL